MEKTKQKDQGKYIELPGAEKGKVVVRFPPEASGFLHIGHAKAALLNQYYQQAFDGKLIMRFDDTNPAKETAEFEKVILEDLKILHVHPDIWSHTSDHFDLLISYCERLLNEGKAYVDDTNPDVMKQEREQRKESKRRNNSVEENLRLWNEMKNGSELGQTCCVRIKIDMNSNNGALRDPTIYRCKNEPHLRTGDKYKVYPTYDFACPIVDSVENVTHALRTTEYHDRDDQYYFILNTLGLRKPTIWDYSRLNMTNTVMSKRKLTWFVDQGLVEGWEDPRFPTVRGIMRRGMTVDGLKQFIISQGSSKNVVMMDWDKIWAFNKKVIDPIAPRFTALLKQDLVHLNVPGVQEESKNVAKHPKNQEIGEKSTWYGSKIFIEQEDAKTLKPGDAVTLINWGNIKINKIDVNDSGIVTSIESTADFDNKDFKNTVKLTWLADVQNAPVIPLTCVHYDHIISKAVLGKDEDFKEFINSDSKHCFSMVGEPELAKLQKGDIIQLQRKGFYICDQACDTLNGKSLVLFEIPDGHTKEMPTAVKKASSSSSVQNQPEKGGKKEKKGKGAQQDKGKTEETASKKDLAESNEKTAEIPAENKEQIAKEVSNVVSNETTKSSEKKKKKSKGAAAAANQPLAENFENVVETATKASTVEAPQSEKSEKIDIGEKGTKESHISNNLPTENEETKKEGGKKSKGKKKKSNRTPNESVSESSEKSMVKNEENAAVSATETTKNEENVVSTAAESKKDKKKAKGKAKNEAKVGGAEAEKKADTKKEADKKADLKKQTRLGLEVKKEDNFSEWYCQIITKAEMIEYYDVSGCYVIRPWAYAVWEEIQHFFDAKIKQLGVSNCYFPMFVSKAALEKEKSHISDFAPEVAWVTKSGQSDLAEPIAVRPTSETVMYPSFAKWVQSHRDLPIKINQWCNVVRWEFKHPTPFLRTREFLWQEGHTAHANKEDAVEEVHTILDFYAQVYENLLAVPVIKGRKTEKEKFAGADFTTTIEVYIPGNGRGIQAATSHHLGQNFSKMFEIVFEDPETKQKQFAYQNSWGLTTRSLGVFSMVHGDNQGLVLPPRVAKVQIVIIPCGITANTTDEEEKKLLDACSDFCKQLRQAGLKAEADLRDNYSPGWKYNHWELKGVPIRVELGPRELAQRQLVVVRRDTGDKTTVAADSFIAHIKSTLDAVHDNLLFKAKQAQLDHLIVTESWEVFLTKLDEKFFVLAPFCGSSECEEKIKKDSAKDESTEVGAPAMGAKSLCIPFEQPKQLIKEQKCFYPSCGQMAQYYCLFGRSY